MCHMSLRVAERADFFRHRYAGGLTFQNTPTHFKTLQKWFLSFAILAIRYLTRSLQSMRFQVPADGTNNHGHHDL